MMYIFSVLFSIVALAQSSNEIYLACEKKNAEPEALQKCLAAEIEEKAELRSAFSDSLARLDRFLADGKTGVAKGCHSAYLKFEKKGKNVRLSSCTSKNECTVLSHVAGLYVNEKQRDQILNETATIHRGRLMGVEVQHSTPRTNGMQLSCDSSEGICHKLFEQFLGFVPSVDRSYGSSGTQVDKMNDAPEGTNAEDGPFYHIKRKVEFEAPLKLFVDRLPQMFSARGGSLLAGFVDRNYSEEKMRSLLFNVSLLPVLKQRLTQFGKSRDSEMKFSFVSWGSSDFCADEVHQRNRIRRGLSIFEAFLLRKKDDSGDLAHTMGAALRTVGGGANTVVEGFGESMIQRRRTR